jgi:hypothetical protein
MKNYHNNFLISIRVASFAYESELALVVHYVFAMVGSFC